MGVYGTDQNWAEILDPDPNSMYLGLKHWLVVISTCFTLIVATGLSGVRIRLSFLKKENIKNNNIILEITKNAQSYTTRLLKLRIRND